MKKQIPFLFLLFSFYAVMAGPVDQRLAQEVGQKFMEARPHSKNVELNLVSVERNNQGQALYYLFTTGNGFVVVAGDDGSTPILAYSDEGVFDMDDMPIQMTERLQGYAEQIQYGIEHRIPADEAVARQWKLVRAKGCLDDSPRSTYLDPLITVNWNQNCYYNSFCPEDAAGPCGHTYAGCNATAMGMIMHYWQYPKRGIGTVTYTPAGYPEQSVDLGTAVYEWDKMPESLNASSTNDQVERVAKLLWHFGVAAKSNYGATSTGAVVNNVLRALIDNYGYSDDLYFTSSSDNSSWLDEVKANLDKGYPLYYVGSSASEGIHSFVCDGYDSFGMLHFNFGWGGNGNGFYAIGAINPSNHEYNAQNYAAFNIHPQADFSSFGFSVGENKKVTFSKGNLQYNASSDTWRFAPNQYQTIGAYNHYISSTYNGWIDLFGWGTSGQNHGAVCYQPWSTSQTASDYYVYGSGSYNLYDQTGMADWGCNAISNGDNQSGLWRTLTAEEFDYLLNTRGDYFTIHYAMACVNGVNGLLIFPDGWSTLSAGLNFYTDFDSPNPDFSSHVYDGDDWRRMEASGVVFLPVGGWRAGNNVYNTNQYCNYWTSSRSESNPDYVHVIAMGISSSHMHPSTQPAYYGFSVRLVRDYYSVTVTSDPLNGGYIEGAGSFNKGETCTLTATANPGFVFSHWLVNGALVSTSSEYSFMPQENCDVIAHFEPTVEVCDIVFDLYDSAGDGWNGCGVIITPEGAHPLELTLEDGASCSYSLAIPSGSSVVLHWDYGFNPDQCSFVVHYDGGNDIGQFSNLDATFVYGFAVSCSGGGDDNGQAIQAAVMTSGWNWFSSYVEYDETAFEDLKEALASQCSSVIIKSQYDGFVSYEAGEWGGLLSSLDNAQMYLIMTDNDIAYTMSGPSVDPTAHPVVLVWGWNWIGYPLKTAKSIDEALAGMQPTDGDIIKSQSGFSSYEALEGAWQGTLQTLEPGKGYIYLSNNMEAVNLVFPYDGGSSGTVPEGATDGKFTVDADGKQVYFSQGNLQYKATTNTWRFAENQWDYVRDGNGSMSESYDGWIDLFGWGTSGYNHGAVCYQPWSTSTSTSGYWTYGQYYCNLYDMTGQADWGFNAISNGGNTTNTWRTPTHEEWNYVFNTRSTVSGIRYAKATVNGVYGVILVPDDWDASYGALVNPNMIDVYFFDNDIDASQWSLMEQHGAIFLPTAGMRYGVNIWDADMRGIYWSSSYGNSNTAYCIDFQFGNFNTERTYSRYYGYSVRLVQDAQR